nr:hypothetical protein [Deltaproteobacteria bacterium]
MRWNGRGPTAGSGEGVGAAPRGRRRHPGRELARALALDVLRSAAPDSAPWSRAVAVVEGGPLRMRHAVELAGLVMEAAEVFGEGMTG